MFLQDLFENEQNDLRNTKFEEMAAKQRYKPEQQMEIIQRRLLCSGELSYAIEHIGDLTHRMGEFAKHNGVDGNFGYDNVLKKVRVVLNEMRRGYGFDRAAEENIKNSYEYFAEPKGTSFEKYKQVLNYNLSKYAEFHSEIPVYNRAQFLARGAAIALGKQDYYLVKARLEELFKMLESPEKWKENASQFDLNYEARHSL